MPAPSWRTGFLLGSVGLTIALAVVAALSWQVQETFFALICGGMALESAVSAWRLSRVGLFHDGGTLVARRWYRRSLRVRLADLVQVRAVTQPVGDAEVVVLSLSTAERTWVLDGLGDGGTAADPAAVERAAGEIERLARFAGARIRESASA